MSFTCLFPISYFIISNLMCRNTTLYTKFITTLHVMQEHFATKQMFFLLHWQVTDIEQMRSINYYLFQLSTLLFVVLVASSGEKVRVIV